MANKINLHDVWDIELKWQDLDNGKITMTGHRKKDAGYDATKTTIVLHIYNWELRKLAELIGEKFAKDKKYFDNAHNLDAESFRRGYGEND